MCESCNEWYHCTCFNDRGYGFTEPSLNTQIGQTLLSPSKKPAVKCPIDSMSFLNADKKFTYRSTDEHSKEQPLQLKRVTLEVLDAWESVRRQLPFDPDGIDSSEIIDLLKQ